MAAPHKNPKRGEEGGLSQEEGFPRVQQALETFDQIKATIGTLVVLLLLASIFYGWYYLQSYRAVLETTENVVATVQRITQQKGDAKALRLALDEELIINAHHKFFEELALHLAVALFVAFIVIVSVEIYSSLRQHKEQKETEKRLAVSVWRAIFQRLTPEAITRELEDIALAPVIKKKCRYILTFCRPYPDLPDDRVILRRSVRYQLTNVKYKTIKGHPIRSIISRGQESFTVMAPTENGDLAPVTIPRHISMAVNNVNVPLDKVLRADDLAARGESRDFLLGEGETWHGLR